MFGCNPRLSGCTFLGDGFPGFCWQGWCAIDDGGGEMIPYVAAPARYTHRRLTAAEEVESTSLLVCEILISYRHPYQVTKDLQECPRESIHSYPAQDSNPSIV